MVRHHKHNVPQTPFGCLIARTFALKKKCLFENIYSGGCADIQLSHRYSGKFGESSFPSHFFPIRTPLEVQDLFQE